MAYSFLTKKPRVIVIISGGIRSTDYHLFPALKKNIIGEKFNEVRAVRTAVKRIMLQEIKKNLFPRNNNCLICSQN
jgi:hypothetical protein